MKENIWLEGFGVHRRMAPDATLGDYWRAPGSGPLHYTWQDKPHRLLYDLIGEVQHLRHALYLISIQDQAAGGNVTPEKAFKAAQTLALTALGE